MKFPDRRIFKVRSLIVAFALTLTVTVTTVDVRRAEALGECGLSCCLAGATGSGVTLAENLGVSLLYESTRMETIKNGTETLSPDEVISINHPGSGMYGVPTKMDMEKVSLILARPISERTSLLAYIPYIRNNMDMRMVMKMGMMTTTTDKPMDTVEGLGDITLMAFHTLYQDAPIKATERLTLGVGVKTPTGKNDVKNMNGKLVHAMMQPGSGSWDLVVMANYMRAFNKLILQGSAYYQMTSEGSEGYEYGDQLTADLTALYGVTDYTNLGLELNYIKAARDRDADGAFSSPTTSMVDNTENTGITSFFISPVVQHKIKGTGGGLSLKVQIPIHQGAGGYQQVVDSRFLGTVTWIF